MKIVVPLDGSDFASNAARIGIILAKKFKARISFLHIIDWKKVTKDRVRKVPEKTKELFRERANEIIQKEVERAKIKGLEATSNVLDGIPADQIVKFSHDADLIVIGYRGIHSNTDTLGSITLNVLENSKVPVLVAKGEKDSYEKLLVSTDGSYFSEMAFKIALEYARIMDLKEISALYVVNSETSMEEGKKIMHGYSSMAKDLGINLDENIRSGKPSREILKFCEEREIDIVVMGTRGKHAIKRIFLGSVTREVIREIGIPVLVVPPRIGPSYIATIVKKREVREVIEARPLFFEKIKGGILQHVVAAETKKFNKGEAKKINIEDIYFDFGQAITVLAYGRHPIGNIVTLGEEEIKRIETRRKANYAIFLAGEDGIIEKGEIIGAVMILNIGD
ncbi:MAG: universal stress protein [Candidatus Hydrothermarchaeota archaeon]